MAYAKVNLTLEVLRRPPEAGYHDIASVMQTVGLYDELTFEPAPTLEVEVEGASLASTDNLVWKAARLLQETTRCPLGAHIHLTKRIPLAAGLGGGSSDAAAALLGLQRLWDLTPPFPELVRLAAQLGSDVPFFLGGGTALVLGRGEQVHPLPPLKPAWLVLLVPPLALERKTATLYARLTPGDFTTGEATQRLVEAIHQGQDLDDAWLTNAFQRAALEVFPQLETHETLFYQAGAQKVHLAGSGPTLFALVPEAEAGRAMVEQLRARGLQAHLVQTINPPSGGEDVCL